MALFGLKMSHLFVYFSHLLTPHLLHPCGRKGETQLSNNTFFLYTFSYIAFSKKSLNHKKSKIDLLNHYSYISLHITISLL